MTRAINMLIYYRLVGALLILIFCNDLYGINGDGSSQKHVLVAMRMIGHEVLMNVEDCSSRVLPIEQDQNQYRISFEDEFEIDPDGIVMVINQIILESKVASHYFVEIIECANQEIVYSYEMGNPSGSNFVPCRGRILPKDCYEFLITLVDGASSPVLDKNLSVSHIGKDRFQVAYLLVPGVFLLGFIGFYVSKRNNDEDPNLVMIGRTRFDKKNMTLSRSNRRIQLSSKEADLLTLLHNTVNEPITRDEILKDVWGDEGGYVGRTLDVFVSKLRKKLDADPSIRIVNIRGVGYKMIVNES